MRIFLSAVSSQFKACRDALASDLRAIGCEVRVQEDFQQGPRTLIERLEEYVARCDRVIALVGDAYGFEASGGAVPLVDPPRSYTQWEYCFAIGERLNGQNAPAKELYVYFAGEAYLRQHAVAQNEEDHRRQQSFAQRIKASGKHRASFDNLDQLCRLVLRDGWQMNERPRKPGNLPYTSLGSLFKGREDFLDELHQRPQRTPPRAIVIHGLGGVGKTRLVIEYALRHEAEYTALLSVTADSPQALSRNLAALCAPQVLNLPEQAANEQDVQVAAALRWLDQNPGWLLILDNVDRPEAARALEDLLPRLHGGQVLVTSRLSDWSGSVVPLDLPFLSEEAAVAFLLERTQGRRRAEADDDTAAHTFAKEVDGLALALEQAGAFVWQKRCSLAEYLQRWQAREQKVRTWHEERLMHYPRSMAVTWDTTFDQLDAPAQALLRLLAWLAAEPVPRVLLQAEAARQALAAGTKQLHGADVEAGAVDMEDALAALGGFSLLKWETGNQALRIHRLVQEVTRERLPTGERAEWLKLALAMVNAYLPDNSPPQDVRSWPLWDPMHAHVATLVAAADGLGIMISDPTSRLMKDLGLFLKAKGVWHEVEALYRRALDIDEHSLGPQHPTVAIHLTNLAVLLQDTNRLSEAEPLMRRALGIDEQAFGLQHPDVARDLYNLGALLWYTGRLAEAEPMMYRALNIVVEHGFDPQHPTLAMHLNNLAQLLHATATNRLAEAERLMRRALAIDEQSFGPQHPNVAIRLNNLAQLLQATNRLAEAERLMRRALTINEHSFGLQHPNVAISLNNLAELLRHTNRLDEAERLMRRAVESLLRLTVATGHEHLSLRTVAQNFAALLKQIGRSPDEMRTQLDALGVPFHLRLDG